MNMAKNLDQRLNRLVYEIKEIRKEFVFLKMEKTRAAPERIAAWRELGKKISHHWDGISALEEIIAQREKIW